MDKVLENKFLSCRGDIHMINIIRDYLMPLKVNNTNHFYHLRRQTSIIRYYVDFDRLKELKIKKIKNEYYSIVPYWSMG